MMAVTIEIEEPHTITIAIEQYYKGQSISTQPKLISGSDQPLFAF